MKNLWSKLYFLTNKTYVIGQQGPALPGFSAQYSVHLKSIHIKRCKHVMKLKSTSKWNFHIATHNCTWPYESKATKHITHCKSYKDDCDIIKTPHRS